MKITYDKAADAVYIKLNSKEKYRASKKVTDDVLIDYSKDGTVIGIEVLDASKNMPLPIRQTQVPIESI
jgi:uncharacterized protein YuzE